MTASEHLKPSETPKDLKALLIEGLEKQGFVTHLIVPRPPRRPIQRVQKGRGLGGQHDYDWVDLAWESPTDEALALAFRKTIGELNKEYGPTNVATADPTDQMKLDVPLYSEIPCAIIMVRSTPPPERISLNGLSPVIGR